MNPIAQAKEVMSKNWRNGYTVPCASLYPFQWNWDAGFHALGWMYLDPFKAMAELNSIFKGQWTNGMVPHIVFHESNENYFPGPSVWDIEKSNFAPTVIQTSGITQLPVFGFILERMIQIAETSNFDLSSFVHELFPKILSSHRYLYERRDFEKEGLPCLFHNWESTDNSPIWDIVWENMDISAARDVSNLRKDNKKIDVSMRPTDLDYKRYIYLIDHLVANHYQEDNIINKHPFLVQENMFISFLIRSNESLMKIGKKFGFPINEIENWQKLSLANFNSKFWSEEKCFYYPYDFRNKKLIKKDVVGALVSLFAGIPSPFQAEKLVENLKTKFIKNEDWFFCPSYSASEDDFDANRYWRGPLWPNVNWILFHGLHRYGFTELANQVKSQTIYLIEKYGMFEYFNPLPEHTDKEVFESKGLGGNNFSWTASVYLDFKLNHNLL